jgi:hypothetical protein
LIEILLDIVLTYGARIGGLALAASLENREAASDRSVWVADAR